MILSFGIGILFILFTTATTTKRHLGVSSLWRCARPLAGLAHISPIELETRCIGYHGYQYGIQGRSEVKMHIPHRRWTALVHRWRCFTTSVRWDTWITEPSRVIKYVFFFPNSCMLVYNLLYWYEKQKKLKLWYFHYSCVQMLSFAMSQVHTLYSLYGGSCFNFPNSFCSQQQIPLQE